LLVIVIGLTNASASNRVCDRPSALAALERGRSALDNGCLDTCIEDLRAAEKEFGLLKMHSERLDAAVLLTDVCMSQGQARFSTMLLDTAIREAGASVEPPKLAAAKVALAAAVMFTARSNEAEGLLRDAAAVARKCGDQSLLAAATVNLGVLTASLRHVDEAVKLFQDCVNLGDTLRDNAFKGKAIANLARLHAVSGHLDEARKQARLAVQLANHLSDGRGKSAILLSAAKTLEDVCRFAPGDPKDLFLEAFRLYEAAAKIGEADGDSSTVSYALGSEGHLYELEGRFNEARKLTWRATVDARLSPEVLYRWQWQDARLLARLGQRVQAIPAYRRAVATLQSTRNDVALRRGNAIVGSSLREVAGSLFFELADLLLQEADTDAPGEAEKAFIEARDTVESLKAAELEDYFQDDCTRLLQKKVTRIESISPTAAVIHIIPLSNRTEILVDMKGGIQRFKARPRQSELAETAHRFRANLEDRTTNEYLDQSRQLYEWLIGPLEKALSANKIDTLVFVPDGALQSVPMAALQDGNRFLIEKYSLVVAPGATLLEATPIRKKQGGMLLSALSESVQGFPSLPYVADEARSLKDIVPGKNLINDAFVLPNLEKEFLHTPYSIVHIASHGQFSGNVQDSFILTYQEKLSLNQIETLIRPSQLKDDPVEMISLSACQTAAGDDRAALGLAGIAVKAGARSAFATLWCVNDEASSLLVPEFYSNLTKGGQTNKARSLRDAQIKLMSDERYSHPCYWAPYLIIGNWL